MPDGMELGGEMPEIRTLGGHMTTLKDAVAEFLSQRTLAVAGVSRDGKLPANAIFRKLRNNGYDVYPVNPRAQEVEGAPAFPDLASIPARVGGVVVATPPEAALALVKECAELAIPRVWIHRSFGTGSWSREAEDLCRARGISLIPGACPMMYLEPVDVAHRCFRWFLGLGGKLPEPEGFGPPG